MLTQTLADVSGTTQVLFLTCHRDLRELARVAVPGAVVCDLPPYNGCSFFEEELV